MKANHFFINLVIQVLNLIIDHPWQIKISAEMN